MNVEALLQLRRVVSNIRDEDLYMATWACGTQACALGHAAMDPWFNERGLILDDGNVPTFESHDAFNAAMKLFEITRSETFYIFSVAYYGSIHPTKEDVISHIDDVLLECGLWNRFRYALRRAFRTRSPA